MLGSKSAFQALLHTKKPNVNTYCTIHRETLASSNLSDGIKCAYDLAIKIVNYIKSSDTNFHVFQK